MTYAHVKIGLVVSQFHASVTGALAKAVTKVCTQEGVPLRSVKLVKVPGAWEIPYMAKCMLRLARQQGEPYDCLVALGCLIQGETFHFTQVMTGLSYGLQKVSLEEDCPIIHGVLSVECVEQAMSRIQGSERNRGIEAGKAAMETLRRVMHLKQVNL